MVDQAYNEYSFEENQHLFGLVNEGEIVGCIGVVMASDSFEIKQIEQGDWQRNDGVGM